MSRTLSDILEDVTTAEQKLSLQGRPLESPELDRLRREARNHPSSAPGRDLPPIIGRMGN